MSMTVVFWASTAIVIGGCMYVVLASCTPSGPIGAACLGGAAIFALAGLDQSPPNWLVGFMACLAGAVVWALTRWVWWRSRHRCGVRP